MEPPSSSSAGDGLTALKIKLIRGASVHEDPYDNRRLRVDSSTFNFDALTTALQPWLSQPSGSPLLRIRFVDGENDACEVVDDASLADAFGESAKSGAQQLTLFVTSDAEPTTTDTEDGFVEVSVDGDNDKAAAEDRAAQATVSPIDAIDTQVLDLQAQLASASSRAASLRLEILESIAAGGGVASGAPVPPLLLQQVAEMKRSHLRIEHEFEEHLLAVDAVRQGCSDPEGQLREDCKDLTDAIQGSLSSADSLSAAITELEAVGSDSSIAQTLQQQAPPQPEAGADTAPAAAAAAAEAEPVPAPAPPPPPAVPAAAEAASTQPPAPTTTTTESESSSRTALEALEELGFEKAQAMAALRDAKGDVSVAAEQLLHGGAADAGSTPSPPAAAAAAAAAAVPSSLPSTMQPEQQSQGDAAVVDPDIFVVGATEVYAGAGSAGGAGGAANPLPEDEIEAAAETATTSEAVAYIAAMGFSSAVAEAALAKSGGSLEAALDDLLTNADVDRGIGAEGQPQSPRSPVSPTDRSGANAADDLLTSHVWAAPPAAGGGSDESSTGTPSADGAASDEAAAIEASKLETLTSMGFTQEQSECALRHTWGNLEEAIDKLFTDAACHPGLN